MKAPPTKSRRSRTESSRAAIIGGSAAPANQHQGVRVTRTQRRCAKLHDTKQIILGAASLPSSLSGAVAERGRGER